MLPPGKSGPGYCQDRTGRDRQRGETSPLKATAHYTIFTRFSLAPLSPMVATSKLLSLIIAQIPVVDNPHSSISPQCMSSDNLMYQIFTRQAPIPCDVIIVLQWVLHSRDQICIVNINGEWSQSVRSVLSLTMVLWAACATAHDFAWGSIERQRAGENCTMCSGLNPFTPNGRGLG